MNTEKIKPTIEDVIRALRREVGEGLRGKPQSASELERAICVTYAEIDWNMPRLNRHSLDLVLAELVADFSIIKKTGKEWGTLPPFRHGMSDRFSYYALPAHLEKWERDSLSRTEWKRLELAESLALNELAKKFPVEYQVLVRRELKKLQQGKGNDNVV